jgi:Family of unknown function (DUF5681)
MSDDYQTGYAKPPKHNQFKKGVSGNPAGRPKGSPNLKTALDEELKAKVTLREGGKVKTISKTEALIKAIVNKALSGDTKAAQLATTLVKELLPLTDVDGAGLPTLSDDDIAVLNNHEAFLKKRQRGGDRNGD